MRPQASFVGPVTAIFISKPPQFQSPRREGSDRSAPVQNPRKLVPRTRFFFGDTSKLLRCFDLAQEGTHEDIPLISVVCELEPKEDAEHTNGSGKGSLFAMKPLSPAVRRVVPGAGVYGRSKLNLKLPAFARRLRHTRTKRKVDIWDDLDPADQEFAYEHAIFCNRSLHMGKIHAVGFDMDYTLALYNPDNFERLAYDCAKIKLVELGYPTEILEWEFDPHYVVRGLLIDKARGNLLKMDRHKYVKVAYHGFRQLAQEERRDIYLRNRKSQSYEEPHFALVDTLFSLTDAFLFTQLVDFKERNPTAMHQDFMQIYRDIRRAVDLCHRDGSIKDKVCKDPSKYIKRDPHLVATLRHLKKSGRKLFVVTNSLWDYTHAVMNFLFGNDSGHLTEDWLELFDIVVTGACKPAFFMTDQPLYEIVHSSTGHLRNVDPMLSSTSKTFQGGNYEHLQKLLGVERGSEILYIGDHIYGDILRSKKEIGWRTMLVIEELEHEIQTLHRNRSDLEVFDTLRHIRDALDDRLQVLETLVEEEQAEIDMQDAKEAADRRGAENSKAKDKRVGVLVGANEAVRSSKGFGMYVKTWQSRASSMDNKQRKGQGQGHAQDSQSQRLEQLKAQLKKTAERRDQVQVRIREHLRAYHRRFHPIWGQLMKTGYQNSRFATQVQTYACLYTSRVTNLRFLSTHKSFRSSRDVMPHDPFWTMTATDIPSLDSLTDDLPLA